MEVNRALYARRSIRKFKTDPIPLDLVKDLLETAIVAPSWRNSQCARFLVIDDKNLILNLADTACNPFRSQNILHTAPCVLLVCADPSLCGAGSRTRNGAVPEWFMFDTALAVENICLSATDKGLGSLIIGGFDMDIAKQTMKVPDDLIPVCLVALGYPDEEPEMPQRRPLSEVAFYNDFKEAL